MTSTVLAVDLGGTSLRAALVDAQGRIRARLQEPVKAASQQASLEQIVRLGAQLRRKHTWRAAGIAVPGLVRRDGTVWAPNLPGWEAVPLARLLRKEWGCPVMVESDRNAAVVGETWRGAARGKTDVVVLIVGTGIGAGILSGGRLVRGAHELSGCAGWMVITERDQAIYRRIGCLESLAAGPAVERLGRVRSAEEAAQAARKGDVRAHRVWQSVGMRLGFAVANLISLFDPQVVVLGGGLAGAADLYWDTLKRTALRRAQPLAARQAELRLSRLGNRANLLGAARLALSPPERTNRES